MVDDKKVKVKKEDKKDESPRASDEQPDDVKSTALSIKRSHPFSQIHQMERIIDDMARGVDRFFWNPFGIGSYAPFKLLDEDPMFRMPLSNVSEDEKSYTISAEVPGMDKGDIDITVHEGRLQIKGEKKAETEEKKGKLIRREYSASSFSREFELPENSDEAGDIEASLDNGVLKVKIPKKEQEKKEKKRIPIK